MKEAKITKKTFFKGIGAVAILGWLAPFFKKREVEVNLEERKYPMVARRNPNSVGYEAREV